VSGKRDELRRAIAVLKERGATTIRLEETGEAL